jgi:hypothetical protein
MMMAVMEQRVIHCLRWPKGSLFNDEETAMAANMPFPFELLPLEVCYTYWRLLSVCSICGA